MGIAHSCFLTEYLREAIQLNTTIREELRISGPRLQDVVVVLQNDVELEKSANGLNSLELKSRALQMLSRTRPPDERLLSGLLLAAERMNGSVLEAMVQLSYGVPDWFFSRLLPQFMRLSCKY